MPIQTNDLLGRNDHIDSQNNPRFECEEQSLSGLHAEDNSRDYEPFESGYQKLGGQHTVNTKRGEPRRSKYWEKRVPPEGRAGKRNPTAGAARASPVCEAYHSAIQTPLGGLESRRKINGPDEPPFSTTDNSPSHQLQDPESSGKALQLSTSQEEVAAMSPTKSTETIERVLFNAMKRRQVGRQPRDTTPSLLKSVSFRVAKKLRLKHERSSTTRGNTAGYDDVELPCSVDQETASAEGITLNAVLANVNKPDIALMPESLDKAVHSNAKGKRREQKLPPTIASPAIKCGKVASPPLENTDTVDDGKLKATRPPSVLQAFLSKRGTKQMAQIERPSMASNETNDTVECHGIDDELSDLAFNPIDSAAVPKPVNVHTEGQSDPTFPPQTSMLDYSIYDYDSSPLSSLASTPDFPPQNLQDDIPHSGRFLDDDIPDLHSSALLSNASNQLQLPTSSAPKQRSSRKPIVKKSPYFPEPAKGKISCVPFPPLSSTNFGLVQERLCHNPFQLLIAVIFLNKTRGTVTIPTFYRVMERYPTPSDLTSADQEDLVKMIGHLGLQNQRAKNFKKIASIWIENPPMKGKRYRKLHYPNRYDGKDIKAADEPISDEDPRVAWEIGHLPGIGAYALDSWRIFCRDELRGLPHNIPSCYPLSAEDLEMEMQKEWTRVLPEDKEIRAYLRWRWARCGWCWDPYSGRKTVLEDDVRRSMDAGGVVLDGGGRCTVVREVAGGAGDGDGVGKVLKMRRYEKDLDADANAPGGRTLFDGEVGEGDLESGD
ncbi:MAG: hypothetical protein MMC33_007974 [Icmadophila ericetorum]|nr:hypothetical protein [Icmadophila ericetorum]